MCNDVFKQKKRNIFAFGVNYIIHYLFLKIQDKNKQLLYNMQDRDKNGVKPTVYRIKDT